jgi:hypothetical protein
MPVIQKKQPDKYWYTVAVEEVSELWFARQDGTDTLWSVLKSKFTEYIYNITIHFYLHCHPCEVPTETTLPLHHEERQYSSIYS